jgi:hypothetical protein
VFHSIFIEKQYPKWFLTLDVMQLAKTVLMFTYDILASK